MFKIGELAKQFSISRSTLLYYDKIGLLKPTERSSKNYRLYSSADVDRLKIIIQHREAGIELNEISKLFDIEKNNLTDILTRRLENIQGEIIMLKKQERIILAILIDQVTRSDKIIFDKASWSTLLSNLGFSNKDMMDWHKEFEINSKEEHERFLKAIGMSGKEIKDLKKMLI
ncbi:MAG: MerR family transcriptional regulator [Tissierellales bacterium]|jgi:DNA-binding transcriptional MerR regulator|nr:MerR family transcriptional regulator [Tissierellales bacterium]